MTFKATCYHLRNMKGQKVVGGTLGDLTLDDAVQYLTRCYGIGVNQNGAVHFLHNGEPVWAYLSVDPLQTEKGKFALREWKEARDLEFRRQAELERKRERELDDLVGEIGLDEAIRMLREKRNEDQDE